MSSLQKEIETYNLHMNDLLTHIGKYVLISGDQILGYYEAYADALGAGYEKCESGVFLVKKIAPAEQVSFFTRELFIECRA
jgi:hypothetical protein